MNIVFMGTPDFAVPILRMLAEEEHTILKVVTQPDRPKGRKRTLAKSPVKEEAERQGLEILQPEKLKDAVAETLQPKPDVIITAAYGQLLPEAILTAPPYGCVNVHASLLPKYRGGAPIHQAVIDGEKESGVTLMYMVKKLDAGDMLAQEAVPIADTDTVGTLHDKLSTVGAELLRNTLPKIPANTVVSEPQDEAQVTYAPNLSRGSERIDWKQSAEAVYNHIRGMNPWPIAYTYWGNDRLKIWSAALTDERYEQKSPGEVALITGTAIIVVCGDQYGLMIQDLQPAGKKKMTVGDFLRGQGESLATGEIFGHGEND
ncbi:methionyl-tRNA formyltransferase [Natribacillus halophilus]|uniref:Methionyl-tRNA formyltransferase n=1 Tax=Natribacillus halophilus TaxID=549003 RepID=A0A1G8MHK8_9BACI|nr:methionyl-tRNA formyltransferase [Natribacillus halophilus]SDI67441.1 methionyl-tRNA formyltransferase [Natribacillus halophilus]